MNYFLIICCGYLSPVVSPDVCTSLLFVLILLITALGTFADDTIDWDVWSSGRSKYEIYLILCTIYKQNGQNRTVLILYVKIVYSSVSK